MMMMMTMNDLFEAKLIKIFSYSLLIIELIIKNYLFRLFRSNLLLNK